MSTLAEVYTKRIKDNFSDVDTDIIVHIKQNILYIHYDILPSSWVHCIEHIEAYSSLLGDGIDALAITVGLQTQGVGSFVNKVQRQWVDGEKNANIKLVCLCRINLDIKLITLYSGLAFADRVTQVLEKYNSDKKVCMKWPNDLVIANKKIAGILAKQVLPLQHKNLYLMAIGVNITKVPGVDTASCIMDHIPDKTVSSQVVKDDIQEQLIDIWCHNKLGSIDAAVLENEYCAFKGQIVKFFPERGNTEKYTTGVLSKIDVINGCLLSDDTIVQCDTVEPVDSNECV